MEFKGTKGKWFACCMKNTPHFIFANEGDVTICKPYQKQDLTNLSDEEFRANTLLISKAPKMLELITDMYNKYENQGISSLTFHEHMNKAKQLIKEATEL